MTDGAAITAGLVAALVGLVEVLKWGVKKWGGGKEQDSVTFSHEHERQLRHTYEGMEALKRDMAEMRMGSKEIADTLAKIAGALERVAEMTARAAEMLDKIDRRQEVEDELRYRRLHEGG